MKDTENLLVARLGQALEAAGLTRTALAQRVGRSRAAVDRWFSGEKAPTPDEFEALAAAFEVNAAWLAGNAGEMHASDPAAEGADPAEKAVWDFRPAPRDGGRDYGNSNVWSFDPGLDVLVREALQNAQDAAAAANGRVEVVFRLIRLAGTDKRNFLRALEWDALRGHLEASAAGGQKLGTLLRDGLERIDAEDLLLLVIEDRGTVGLTGPERGQGHFTALCRNNLESRKDCIAGGAFGLGKAVLWRASRLSTVLFGSHLSVPVEGRSRSRLIGRCELSWHQHGAADYAGPGWFGRRAADGGGAESIWEDDDLAGALYLDREGWGTSACVVGFHDPSSDRDRPPEEMAQDLVRAAAQHFFPAMVAGRLAVRVEVYEGRRPYEQRRPSFAQEVKSEESTPTYARMLRAYRDGATVEQLGDEREVATRTISLSVSARSADPKHGEQVHHAVLLVAAAGDVAPDRDGQPERANQLVVFRGPGMVVQRLSLQGACLGARPVHALLLCGLAPGLVIGGDRPASSADLAAEQFLQAAEPPAHDRWNATPYLQAAYSRGCVARLERFLTAAIDGVRDLMKSPPEDSGDGPRSLKDLFRLGDERVPTDRPRVVEQAGSVDDAGRWSVRARIRMKPATSPSRLTPAVYFLGESGDGVAVAWESLQASTPGCVADGGSLMLPAGIREVRFSGLTDPLSHPVPASASCVSIEIEKLIPIREIQS